jgi:hypothetical protein
MEAMMAADDELLALCRAARPHEDPNEEDRLAVRAKVMAEVAGAALIATGVATATQGASVGGQALGSVLPGAGAVTSGAAKGWVLSSTAAWLVGGGASGVVAALVIQSAVSTERPPPIVDAAPASAVVSAQARAASGSGVPTVDSVVPLAAPPPASVEPVNRGAPVRSPPPRVRAEGAPRLGARPDLREEASGLARVQRALRAGRAGQALTLLDAQDQKFARGALAAERLAARVLALCATANPSAGPLAQRFLKRYPESPLAARVRRSCSLPAPGASGASR